MCSSDLGSVLAQAEAERLESAAEIAADGVRSLKTADERSAWLETVCEEGELGSVLLLDGAGRVVAKSGEPQGDDPVVRDRAAIDEARVADAGVGEPFLGRDGATYAAAYALVDGTDLVLGVEALAPTGRVAALQTG